jgi:hypothetical protein
MDSVSVVNQAFLAALLLLLVVTLTVVLAAARQVDAARSADRDDER